MTFTELNLHYDMEYMYRRIERNLRAGVAPERVRKWVADTAKAVIPPGGSRAQEYKDTMTDLCGRWINYCIKYPSDAPAGEYLPNAAVEKMRIEQLHFEQMRIDM